MHLPGRAECRAPSLPLCWLQLTSYRAGPWIEPWAHSNNCAIVVNILYVSPATLHSLYLPLHTLPVAIKWSYTLGRRATGSVYTGSTYTGGTVLDTQVVCTQVAHTGVTVLDTQCTQAVCTQVAHTQDALGITSTIWIWAVASWQHPDRLRSHRCVRSTDACPATCVCNNYPPDICSSRSIDFLYPTLHTQIQDSVPSYHNLTIHKTATSARLTGDERSKW